MVTNINLHESTHVIICMQFHSNLIIILTDSNPSMEEHGLDENILSTLEYIIGPKATISPPRSQLVSVNHKLIQLCLKCADSRKMWKDFNLTLQEEFYVEEMEETEEKDSATGDLKQYI